MFDSPQNNFSKRAKYITYGFTLALSVFGIVTVILFFVYQEAAMKEIYKYKKFMTENIACSLMILFGINTVACCLMLPSALFPISCGFIFGTYFKGNVPGYFLSVIIYLTMQALAGMTAMNLSRLCLKEKLQKYIIQENEKLRLFDAILIKYGAKALFLLRLSPLTPCTVLTILLGGFNGKSFLIQVSNSSYFISAYGSFPGEALNCFIGYNAVNFEQLMSNKQEYGKSILTMIEDLSIILIIFGAVILIVLMIVFTRLSKNNFNKLMEEQLNQEKGSDEMTKNVLELSVRNT